MGINYLKTIKPYNLLALCQRCHNKLDMPLRIRNRKSKSIISPKLRQKEKMTKEEAIKKLKEQQKNNDTEEAHSIADDILLSYVNDKDIIREYDLIDKWYA